MASDSSGSPRIVFMGSGPFALPVLAALAGDGIVVAVVTQPDRAAGRGRKTQRGLIVQKAVELGLPVMQPETFKESSAVEALAGYQPDALVVASYGRILPRALLELPRRGALNLHPSMLPRHRGPSPVASAILSGDAATGVTVMEMIAKMDAGPIVAQRAVRIQAVDTTDTLTQRLAKENAQLLMECLPGWLSGARRSLPQPEEGATYTRLLTKAMGVIDWSKPAVQLERQVRAFVPWPVACSVWPGGVIRIFRAGVLPGNCEPATQGQVVALEPNGIVLQTGEDRLVLREVQARGGRRLPAAEFVRGHPEVSRALFG